MSVHHVAAILGPDGHQTHGPSVVTMAGGVLAGVTPDAGGTSTLVAMPPLGNSHDHGRGHGLASVGIADGPLEPWIERLAADRRTQTDLVGNAARSMLGHGIGATVLCVNPGAPPLEHELLEAATAAVLSGIRAAVVVPYADCTGRMRGRDEVADTDALSGRLRLVQRLTESVADVDWQLGPVGPQWVSEYALSAISDFALEHGVRLHMHLLESPAQRRWADDTYPEGIITWLDRAGVLGPHLWIAHGTQLRADEIALLAARGCGLTLNASSNLRLCSGIAPVADVLTGGLDAAMGLDGLSLNDDHDPWTELRLLRGLAQARTHRTQSAAEILALAFNTAAMGTQRTRPLTEGQPVDLLVVDVAGYDHLLGHTDWTLADVVLAVPLTVHALWVNGQLVVQPDGADDPIRIGELT